MENQGQGNDNINKNKEEKNLTDPDQFKSITDWWQRNSPLAWSETYNEYLKYTTSMTEIYKEYIKNSERMTELYKESVKITVRMTKYWLNKFRNPSYSK
jgi:hypothetical protein